MIIKIYKNTRPKSAIEWFVLIFAGVSAMITYYSLFYPVVGSETANKILGVIGLLSLFLMYLIFKGTQFAGRSQMKT
jgi:hypothetical protein